MYYYQPTRQLKKIDERQVHRRTNGLETQGQNSNSGKKRHIWGDGRTKKQREREKEDKWWGCHRWETDRGRETSIYREREREGWRRRDVSAPWSFLSAALI